MIAASLAPVFSLPHRPRLMERRDQCSRERTATVAPDYEHAEAWAAERTQFGY